MDTPILTPEMAAQAHAMISQVHIPAGQASQALSLLNAIAAIANGQAVVALVGKKEPKAPA